MNVKKQLDIKSPVTGAHIEFDFWVPAHHICFEFQVCHTLQHHHNSEYTASCSSIIHHPHIILHHPALPASPLRQPCVILEHHYTLPCAALLSLHHLCVNCNTFSHISTTACLISLLTTYYILKLMHYQDPYHYTSTWYCQLPQHQIREDDSIFMFALVFNKRSKHA